MFFAVAGWRGDGAFGGVVGGRRVHGERRGMGDEMRSRDKSWRQEVETRP